MSYWQHRILAIWIGMVFLQALIPIVLPYPVNIPDFITGFLLGVQAYFYVSIGFRILT